MYARTNEASGASLKNNDRQALDAPTGRSARSATVRLTFSEWTKSKAAVAKVDAARTQKTREECCRRSAINFYSASGRAAGSDASVSLPWQSNSDAARRNTQLLHESLDDYFKLSPNRGTEKHDAINGSVQQRAETSSLKANHG